VVLLRAFAARMGEVLSRETLCKSVGSAINERAIDVQVTRLRRKIEPDPSFPRYLRTVRGQGYRLVDA
jgi:two-component system phosphate regulon response regulator OmpR